MADLGKAITVEISAENYTGSLTSSPTAAVTVANAGMTCTAATITVVNGTTEADAISDKLPPDRTVKQKTVLSGGKNMPQKGKASAEEKLRIVEDYLSGKIGYTEAYVRASVAEKMIRRWVSRYKTEGPTGFLPHERNRSYSKEIKLAAVLDYHAGEGSLRGVCERHGILDTRQLGQWLKVYNRHEDFKEQSGGSHMRLEIVRACIAGGNDYGSTALKYQVSYQQVYTWTKKYREMGEAGLEDRRGRRAGTLPGRTPEEKLRDRIAHGPGACFVVEALFNPLKRPHSGTDTP